MASKLPEFEIRNLTENGGKKVYETEFLIKLADTFKFISPALGEMFQGKEISTRNLIFRIQNARS
jgi:hypothetical protein